MNASAILKQLLTTTITAMSTEASAVTSAATASDEFPADETSTILYVVCTLLLVLTVLGSAGNGLVLYVFTRRRDRLVSTLYIQVLAVIDLLTSTVLMPFTVYMEFYDFHVDSDVVCKLYMFFVTSSIPFSALIMVAIAVDRSV